MPFTLVLVGAVGAASLAGSAQELMQSSVSSSDPMFGPDPAAPVAAPGLWAVQAPDCAGTLGPDIAAWPSCARALRIGPDDAALMTPARDEGAPPIRTVATRYALAPAWPGAPAIVQVEAPGLLDTTFYYAALEPSTLDDSGRFTRARLRPIGCPGPGVAGVGAAGQGCSASTPTGVHEAARLAAQRLSEGAELLMRRVGP